MTKFLEKKIEPDIDGLIAVLRREETPRRVHYIELFLDGGRRFNVR